MPRPFVTAGEAAEILMFAGFTVSLVSVGHTKAICAGGEQVACGYRDGTNWKFHRETIEDFIECNALNSVE